VTAIPYPSSAGGFSHEGFELVRGLIPSSAINAARGEIISVGKALGSELGDVDAVYQDLKQQGGGKSGLLYDACKRMMALNRLAFSDEVIAGLEQVGCRNPALIDVNFRIDSQGAEKYLFDWHQDYWFSVSSRNGIVAWIPLTDVTVETGGLSVIPLTHSLSKLYRVRPGDKFDSYADAVVLDEPIPREHAIELRPSAGDVLFFRFDVLHRSLPVATARRARWTLQARFASFEDEEFRHRGFRPAVVSKGHVPYLEELNSSLSLKGARP
jgi:hypothetical protein